MAASSQENDYVHLLVNKLRKSGQHVEYADINFFKWEIMDHDRDEVLPLLDDLLDKLVLCQDLKQIKMRIFHRKINICSLSCIYTII